MPWRAIRAVASAMGMSGVTDQIRGVVGRSCLIVSIVRSLSIVAEVTLNQSAPQDKNQA